MLKPRNFVKDIRPYRPGKPIEEVTKELGLTKCYKLASNENPLGPSTKAMETLKDAAGEAHFYPDDNCFYIKQKIAEVFGIAENKIVVGSGSVELIELAAKAYLNPGESVVMSDQAFIMYPIVTKIMGGRRIAPPLKDYTHDLAAMADAIEDDTKMIFIANPNNPTGTMVKKDALNAFMDKVPEDILVVIDEAYYEYIKDPDYPESIKYIHNGRNVLVLRTFSKIYGLAGMRIGYGFAPPEIVESLMKVRLPFNVNRLAQIAAVAALDDHEFVERSVANNEQGKAYLYKEFDRLGIKYVPTHANFIFVQFDGNAQEVYKSLEKQGLITRTIREYNFPNSLRITIGSPDQNRLLIDELEKIFGS